MSFICLDTNVNTIDEQKCQQRQSWSALDGILVTAVDVLKKDTPFGMIGIA